MFNTDEQTGKKIKAFRKSLKKTQALFAEEIGVSRQYISNIEIGQKSASLPLLKKICETYEVNLSFFFDEHDPFAGLPADTVRELQKHAHNLSEGAKEEIASFIKYVIAKEQDKKGPVGQRSYFFGKKEGLLQHSEN
jgi:transcriptional regulator with XRE-family HTH domain